MPKPIDIVGIGVCTLDLLMRVEHFPDGEGVQRTNESTLQGGGPVSTALAAASVLGAKTALIDHLGDDWRGELIQRELAGFGVGMEHAPHIPQTTSCIASVWVRRRDGGRSIAFSAGSVPELTAEQLPDGVVESAKILHTNGRHWDAMFEAAKRAKSAQTLVSFDGGAHRFREVMREFIPLVDIAIVAREWAERFSLTDDVVDAAAIIQQAGPGLVVITDGLAGSWIVPRGRESFHQPAFPIDNVIDTTGCGDVYHGAFLTGLARNWELAECARIASAMAALNTKGLGGRGNLASLADIRAWIGADHGRH
ncbi:MAG: PfkB family carbohydrate kinase [Verrucomicrobiota bacterium]